MQSVSLVKLSDVSPLAPLRFANASVPVPICQTDSQKEFTQGGRSGSSDTAAEKGQPNPSPVHMYAAFQTLRFCICGMLWKTSSTQRRAMKPVKGLEHKSYVKRLRELGPFRKEAEGRLYLSLQLPGRRLWRGGCWPLFPGNK